MPQQTIPDIPEEAVAEQAVHPDELYERILTGEGLSILDVRMPEAAVMQPLQFGERARIVSRPFAPFLDAREVAAALPEKEKTLVVCTTSRTSRAALVALRDVGARVEYLLGGTRAWDQFMDVRDVFRSDTGAVVQVARPGRGDLSFVILAGGEAAVIDPLRDVEAYREVVGGENASLAWVLDTHAHADHISGGPRLAAEAGVPYYLHPYDAIHPVDMLPAKIPFCALDDGKVLDVGGVRCRAIWFPGHTLGMVMLSFSLEEQHCLLTGDGVFLDSIGRPDLGGRAEAWAGLLFESVSERLPNAVNAQSLILPGHFATFASGEGGIYCAPYHKVRRENPWLETGTREAYISRVVANLAQVPPAYVEMKRINAGLKHVTEETALDLEAGPNLCAVSG